MENTYDVIIVGAGPAGMTAAIYAIRANMKVLMLDRLSPAGRSSPSTRSRTTPARAS